MEHSFTSETHDTDCSEANAVCTFQFCIIFFIFIFINMKKNTVPITNTSFLVVLHPTVFALITVLIGCSSTGFAGWMAFCRRRWSLHSNFKQHTAHHLWVMCRVCARTYLCTGRRCHSSLRWSSRRCSPGRTPLRSRGDSCTCRSLHESHRRRTSRFHDKVCQSLPHRLQGIKPQRWHTCKNSTINKTSEINCHWFLGVFSIECLKQNQCFPHHYSLAQMFPLDSTLW